jgi:hypothetical protein
MDWEGNESPIKSLFPSKIRNSHGFIQSSGKWREIFPFLAICAGKSKKYKWIIIGGKKGGNLLFSQ